jgi:Tol biopolymer transport system component
VVSLSEVFSQDSYLSRVPLAGGEPERLSFGEGAEWVSIARTGGRLAYDLIQYNFDIWRVSGPNSSEIVSPTRFPASSNRVESLPDYSPDGSRIAFVSGRSGDTEIWQCDAEGTQLQQLTRLGLAWLGEWSPSGDRIAFCASEGEEVNWDILVVNSTGGLPRNLTHDEFDDACPSWSPDGQWIYYHSLRGGDRQICQVSSEGGATVQLTEKGGLGPRVGEDGQVFFWRNERIWSLPRDENGGEESLALDKKVNSFLNWCTWEDNIVYISGEGGREPSIEMFNLTSGVTKKLHSLGEGINPANGLTVSPDGWWILYTQFEFSADLMLVENFY